MTEKNKNKEGLKYLEKLSNEEKAFIRKLFEEYLRGGDFSRINISRLGKAISRYFTKKIGDALLHFVFEISDLEKNIRGVKKEFPKAVKLLKELSALYGTRYRDSIIGEEWPTGVRGIKARSTVELEEKKSIITMIFHTNDGKYHEFTQPLLPTLGLLEGVTIVVNNVMDELKKANIDFQLEPKKIKSLQKEITKLQKKLEEMV